TLAPAPLTLVSKDGRRTIPTVTSNGRELIALDDIASLFQVAVREDSLAGGFTITYRGKTIVASADQPMASVDGRIVTLPSSIMRNGRRWLVPIEFLPRALGPIYDQRIDLRSAARLLLVGDMRVPRVSARIESAGPPTRAAIVISPATPVAVVTEANRLVLRVEADAIEPVFPVTASGLIDSVRVGDQPNVVLVALNRQAGPAKTGIATADNATRVLIEVPMAEARPAAPESKIPPTGPPLPTTESSRLPGLEPRQALRILAIDPGHGGDEVGVRGADGLEEKQLTLDIARRLRSLVERGLGVRVILTRDDDRLVPIDERAAAANNGKADLLVSLHANGALTSSPSGAEVYYDRLDREGEAARRLAAEGAVALPVVGGGRRTIDVVPWELAQARHVEASA